LQPTLEVLEDRTLLSSSSILQSNFNGTPIAAGSSVWFNSVLKVNGLGSKPVTIRMVDSTIDFTANGSNVHLNVPNAAITFSPTVTAATTTFDATTNTWITTVPMKLGGNTFLAGLDFPVMNNLAGGIKPVTWQGQFQTDTSGVTVNWQWAAAVYTQFSTDSTALAVKPVDDNQASAYQNSDHAGTPENYRSLVTGGACGGGGSNFTGSYSGTAQVQPTVVLPGSSLSGFVTNKATGVGLANVLVTLTGTNDLGQIVTLRTTTSANGSYRFTDLQPGTYTLTETPPAGFVDNHNTIGSLGGGTSLNRLADIVLNEGVNGVNYDFADLFIPFGQS
jgi:hypothetical protein